MGKLVGVVGVALLLTLVYFSGGFYALVSSGRWDLFNPALIGANEDGVDHEGQRCATGSRHAG